MRSDLVCLNLFLRLGKTKSYDQKREREMVTYKEREESSIWRSEFCREIDKWRREGGWRMLVTSAGDCLTCRCRVRLRRVGLMKVWGCSHHFALHEFCNNSASITWGYQQIPKFMSSTHHFLFYFIFKTFNNFFFFFFAACM